MRVRKLFIRVVLAVVLLAIVTAVSVRGLVVSEPRWYRPVVIDEAAQALGQKKLQNRITDLRNEVGRVQVQTRSIPQPNWPVFEVEFTEDEINGTLSRWQSWPPLGHALGKVSEPHVRFLDGRIEFAGRTGADGPLISIELSVEQTRDGPKVALGRPWAGRLPLSRSPLESIQDDVGAKLRDSKVPQPTIDSLLQLIAGETIAPVVAVPSNVVGQAQLLPAKVEKLTIEDGLLRATLRPFDPKVK